LTKAFADKEKQGVNGLFVIKCECGAEILMLPKVKMMSKAIEEHVELHKQRLGNSEESDAETDRIRNFLITQVLQRAGDLRG